MLLETRGELLPYREDFYLWSYVPSIPAAVIFLIIFLALSALHTWKMVKLRTWFCLPFVIGGFLEVIGFGGRIGANNDTANMIPYIIQSIFLLVPPSLFAASIYMTLGRVMTALGPDGEACSIIRVRWLTTTFVIGDVVSFLVQASGAGFSSAGDDPKTGEIIVVMGLIIQIIFFGLFVTAAVIFHYRYRQCDHQAAHFSWRKILSMLYMASALILVRSIFRIIEYAMGSDAYPLKNEWTLYIFDSLLMSVVMLVFFIWYPPNFQTGNGRGNGGYKLSNMTGP